MTITFAIFLRRGSGTFLKANDMTSTPLSLLDQAELLQLAANASAAGDPGATIGFLKEAVSRPDASGVAHYLLGAEYAQSKMYDRAVGEMEAALALDPGLSTARLQLGLLWLSGGIADKAGIALAPLEELPATDPLRSFGKGLRHLIKDELQAASELLRAGIALNSANPALNQDMQLIVDNIAKLGNDGGAALPAEAVPPENGTEEGDARHMLLSIYNTKL